MSNQESIETRDYRNTQRASAFVRKDNRCDLCGGRANSLHEILFRSSTLNNEEARRLSFQEPLLAILCPTCHDKAHNPETSARLLMQNAKIYGHQAVNEALQAVRTVLKGRLGVALVEEEETDG